MIPAGFEQISIPLHARILLSLRHRVGQGRGLTSRLSSIVPSQPLTAMERR